MYYERLLKRESKVTRLLNYMLDAKNDLKILQCYRLRVLINDAKAKEQKEEFERSKSEFTRRANWIRKVKIN